ncbi:RraA family protein [Planosporangium mesophilum]|uniref:Putative 4-hydroxy-4-methyl-2-oxoglutarate aldolase n=1 Tax=Planosporangium mesophilum TaxID=689768 RepID=A0A8J3X5T7_9ACTN|nr:RraA family protein [Planosporangium mesophilum]NJC85884.1 RraA family protein [Planosporangium mesophilum]GII25068.1 diguanylate cyclase [Planosporangium mesophilum]
MSGQSFPEEVAALPTAAVSDALDALGIPGQLLGLAPLAPGQRLLGRAYTVRYVATGVPPGTVGDYIDDVPPGAVVVLDNGGRVDCTVWGDILTAVASTRRVAGTVIDGVCRDTHRARTTGYPIYSRGYFMRTGKDRVAVSDIEKPVSIAGVQVRPGDLILGDSDGVLTVPAAREAEVLEKALEIERVEAAILAEAIEGGSLRQARARLGYHTLQRRGGAPAATD